MRPEIYENPKLEFGIVTWDNGQTDFLLQLQCFLLTVSASTWFALMPWASGSLIEGLVSRL